MLPSALPSSLPTTLPSSLPTMLPSALPSSLPTTLPSSLPTTSALPSSLPPLPSPPPLPPTAYCDVFRDGLKCTSTDACAKTEDTGDSRMPQRVVCYPPKNAPIGAGAESTEWMEEPYGSACASDYVRVKVRRHSGGITLA